MRKNIFKLLGFALIISTVFSSCEDVNEKLGLDDNEIIDTRSIEHTLGAAPFGDKDYTVIVNQLRYNKNHEDSVMATTLNSTKTFSVDVPAEYTIPFLLKDRYYSRDAGTTAKIKYKYKWTQDETFESMTAGTGVAVSGNGWIVKDLIGAINWEARSYNNNKYAQVSSFRSGGKNEVWMIRAFDLSKLTDPLFTFDLAVGNWTADCLEIKISENFDGDTLHISSSKWDDLKGFNIPSAPASGYGAWANAGVIDLNTYKDKEGKGKVYIAFKYSGDETSTPKRTTTYQIDNVKVYDKEKPAIEELTAQFIRTEKDGWVFNPTVVVEFKNNKTAYQQIVNYVAAHQGVDTPSLLDSRGNAEFYYGFSAYYANVTYRDKDRVFDPSYPESAPYQEKTKFMDKRTAEGLAAYLSVEYPNATPEVSGITQLAIIKGVLIYSDPSSSIQNQYFNYTLQCVGDKKWKAISRQLEGSDVIEELNYED